MTTTTRTERFAIYKADSRVERDSMGCPRRIWFVKRDGLNFTDAGDRRQAQAWARFMRFTSPAVSVNAVQITIEEYHHFFQAKFAEWCEWSKMAEAASV